MFKISYCVIKVGNLHIINKLEFRPAKGVFASFLVCIISFTTIATPISQIQAQEIPEKLSGTCKNDQLEVSIKYLTDQKTIFARGEKITIDFEVTNVKHNSCNLLTETNDSVQLLSKESQKISKHTKKTTVEFRTLENGQSTIDLTVYSGKNIQNAEILCKSYIYAFTIDEMTFISYNCFEETEDAYHTWLLETNQINLEEYKNLQEEMFELTEEDAEIVNAIYPSKTRAASSNVTVFGKMQWTDSSGKKHPLNEIRIEIWDDDPVEDDLITTVYTDSNGNFSSTFANDTSENGYDIYLKVIARGRYVQVTYPSGNIHYGKITLGSNIANGSSLEASYTLLNSNTIGKAFQVQQAASMASNYVRQKTGSYLDTVYVRFPYNDGTSVYNGTNWIRLLNDDYCDWDVIQHEYGHYVAKKFGFSVGVGGNHDSATNLADVRESKYEGIRLAWSEGWATYFAISLQRDLSAISLNIPDVGDLKYTDTIDSTRSYSLENCTSTLGEANEYCVAAILWDIADGANESWTPITRIQ